MDYRFSDKIAALKPSAIREIFKSLTDPTIISFAAGNPAPDSFPVSDLERIGADIFANSPVTALQYSITEGYLPLREAVENRLRDKFYIGGKSDSTIIVSGGQQGIELACKVLCNEGDAVICENPSFIGALNAFRSNGAVTVGVPMEDDGIDVDALEQTIKKTPRSKMIYLIPTFQNPAGITTSLAKRKAIYEVCKKYGLMILEDNPYGELRFAGHTDAPVNQAVLYRHLLGDFGAFPLHHSQGPDRGMRHSLLWAGCFGGGAGAVRLRPRPPTETRAIYGSHFGQ